MVQSRLARIALRVAAGFTVAFLYAPIVVLALYAFNRSRVQRWPIDGLSLQWFGRALTNEGARAALLTSVRVGLGATLIALVLGSLAAFAVQRYRFFGRETISFLVVIPIALPGIVTGMALNATFSQAPLLAGAPFAFALSFDEVIVTTFTVGDDPTLPIWILRNYSRPNQGPIVNAVGVIAILLSIVPVYLAQRLTGSESVRSGGTLAR